ncbi:hypothetical protein GC194_00910 [bacterium]|nr:hypothetical protein [bacterium]
MTWIYETTPLNGVDGMMVHIKEEGYALSFDEVLGLLENDETFRSSLIDFLKNLPFEAFNIEMPPINVEKVNRPFEFVIINTQALLRMERDTETFKSYFAGEPYTAVFENRGGDALLISPVPQSPSDNFVHLAPFLREAHAPQLHDFLVALSEITSANLGNENLWINTSGLGVGWLHLRLDDSPKYYQYKPYKQQN